MSATSKPRHNRKTCEHCHDGYRTDYLAADHYGRDTVATRKCDAGVKACLEHRCYWSAP